MSTVEQLLSVALLTPLGDPRHPATIWGVPINLIGLSGIGKSDRIRAIGKLIGLSVYPVYCTTKQPEDFTGVPVPIGDGIVLECILPAARACINEGRGCIFLDEISDARPTVQAALHSFINDRQVGDHHLPPKTRILLAMNPIEHATAGYGLSPAMANRMGHYAYKAPTSEEWGNWLFGRSEPPIANIHNGEQLVTERFYDHWPQIQALGYGFMQRKGDDVIHGVLHKQPDAGDDKAGGPWPSHRTWTWLLYATTAVRCLDVQNPTKKNPRKLQSLELEFAKALVGPGAAKEWVNFVAKSDLPDPAVMVKQGWQPTNRIDFNHAALGALTSYVTNRATKPEQQQTAQAAWMILKACVDGGIADITRRPAQDLIDAKLAHEGKVPADLKAAAEEVIYQLSMKGFTEFSSRKR
jgi:hypothetical protein